ncbi:hypothetical protein DACRYDRAFT_115496 [Dacryopinax primogenitus]|uniref:BTB domain-containing protein n=1 Tax=Dacryopinax primogenitus (strain DJM 731) TaxID=1858805 RepID=M5GEJ2_DACPD|nr:uncharacterized protein DACRYDRAFT_115496 [Dacryopinax primogenitus]EJU03308.1 hypothetical protein DACRYDRAFT_115496 [Dacryopinax primogenitus]
MDLRRCQRHEKYYWEDGNVVFLVEHTLFRVHRYLFEQSAVFNAMFSLPPPQGTPLEGSSDSNPIRLEGVDAVAFERLLWYMYPGYRIYIYQLSSGTGIEILNRFHGDLTAISADGWVQILDMATMFDFERIRSNAINVLSRCPDPMFKLTVADRFDVDEWRLSCYAELCMRPAFFTEAEMQQMGPETAALLVHARELVRSHLFRRAHGHAAPWPCPNGKDCKRNGCGERIAQAMCDVLLKGTESTATLVPVLYSVLGPKDKRLRENGLCGYCVLQWDRVIYDYLGEREEVSPVCGLPIATLPRDDERQMSAVA